MSSEKRGPSRRAFIASGAAASVYFWIPKPVKGYSASEMRGRLVDAEVVKPGI
jgi:hypothetical protein